MFAGLDIPVIETYQQLAAVIVTVVVLVVGLGRIAQRLYRATGVQSKKADAPVVAKTPEPTVRAPEKGSDFDRLASMITDVSVRAEQVSAMQSKAAVKLDSAEMAVRRMLDDISGVMDVPQSAVVTAASPPQTAASPARNMLAA